MKKLLAVSVMLVAMSSQAFAAGLIDDSHETENQVQPTVVRYAYIMNRLDSTVQEFAVANDSDYTGVITELQPGNLVVTGDDQLNFNLLAGVNAYSSYANSRKISLRPVQFSGLTANEQKKYAEIKDFYIYEVDSAYTVHQPGNNINIQNSVLEDAQYVVSMITQIKSLRYNF